MEAKDIKFGTDGWRGVMAREFTFENVRRVAQAVAEWIKNQPGARPPVIIGYDRRFSSDAFAHEMARVVAANQLKVTVSSEPLPTPAVTMLTQKLKAVGLVVTASHNPPAFNGVKIKLQGRPANEGITQQVESFLDRAHPARAAGAEVPTKSYLKDYVSYLRTRSNPARFIKDIKRPVVVDYLHGASGGILSELLPKSRLVEIRASRDPLFGGVNPEPIEENLEALKKTVVAQKALLGIAIDGDGDRVAIIDDQGRYLTPCQVFPIVLEYLIANRGVKGKVVQSVSLGYLSGRIAKAHGLPFEELPVGFKHVAEQIAKGEAAIAGEESGGYAWKGGLAERDGLVTGLLMLEICAKTKKTPSELWKMVAQKYGDSHFKRVDFRIHRPAVDKAAFTAKIQRRLPKKVLNTPIKQILDLDGIKVILEDDNWVLMRPSGTEPLIRTYAEADKPERTQALLEQAARWVNAHL
ncbi:MAG: phosphoglucomutase/phosphomannomutase family protein [Elusimicrobia bacterium]|nr:phosphoglucomutase/phosphomannomutase family protein [Elusimicrobiota bacterium]